MEVFRAIKRLFKIYTICLMDFKFDDTRPDHLMHEIKLINTQTKEVFNDLLTFLYVEIVKFNKQEHELVGRDDQWLYVLHNLVQLKEIPLSLANDPVFKLFFMDAEEANLKEAELWAYYASKKAKWDAYAQTETAKIEGVAEGLSQGISEGTLVVAQNMLKKGIDIQTVYECTDIPIDKLKLLE